MQYRPEFLFLGARLRVGRFHLLQKLCQTFKVSWVGIDIENGAIAVNEFVGDFRYFHYRCVGVSCDNLIQTVSFFVCPHPTKKTLMRRKLIISLFISPITIWLRNYQLIGEIMTSFVIICQKKTILMTNDDKTEEKNSLHLRSFIKSAIFARPYQKIINLNKI